MSLLTVLKHDNSARASGARFSEELSNAQAALFLSPMLVPATIATATTTSQVKSTATCTYLINGVFKSKTATDPLWTLSGTTVSASSFQKYLLLLDASGTASIQEGLQSTVSAATVAWTNVSNYSSWAPLLTLLASGVCIIGAVTVATDATHTFVPGTTLLGAAGITTTYQDGLDVSLLPLIGNETGLVIGNF